MAKFNGGIFSKLKGKLAGVVFQQYEGMQVGKEYQPNVKNPSTASQVENRAKFKLASQIVAVFQDVLMIAASGISPYVRIIRGKLVAVIRAASKFEQNSASIDNDVFEYAVNSLHLNPIVQKPVIAGDTISNATITAVEGDVVEYTIVAVDEEGGIAGTKTTRFTAAAAPTQIVAPLTPVTPAYYRIAAVAMRATTGEGAAIFSNLVRLSIIDVSYGVRSGDVEVSHFAYAEI